MKYKSFFIKKWKLLIPSIVLFALSLVSIYFFCVSYIFTGVLFLLAFLLPAVALLIYLIYLDSCYFIFNDCSIVYHSFFKKDISFNVDSSLIVYTPDKRLMNSRKLRVVINDNEESFVFRISDEGVIFLKEKYQNNVEDYLNLKSVIKHPIRRGNVKRLIIAGGIAEGCIVNVLLIALLVLLISPPPTIKTKTTDYHYIYDVVNDSNKLNIPSAKKKSLLGYGEYMYNSFLLLTPREAPTSLTSFYFRWRAGMDVDELAYYFECKLNSTSFANYVIGLENFKVNVGGVDHYLIKDEEHFENTTYIVQWLTPSKKWESLEYILVDSENSTVIYVYSFLDCLNKLEEKSSYKIKPNVNVEKVIGTNNNITDGFSVYLPDKMNDSYYLTTIVLEDLDFDNSFLSFLM